MGEGIKSAFEAALHIGSPSKDFRTYGFQSGQGYALGTEDAAPVVRGATTAMASEAKSAVAPAGGASSAPAPTAAAGGVRIGTIENHFHIAAGKGAEETKAALSSESFLGQLERSVRVLLQSQGIPTGSPSPSGG